jgi:hemerythrin superfamily protein
MDATELLKADHDLIKKLLQRYGEMEPGDGALKKSLFRQIRNELDGHAAIEEELFYPAVRSSRAADAQRLVREAFEEHRLVKQLLRELGRGRPGTEAFDAKFKVLKENVLHHAKEEEHDLFPEAWDLLSPEELEALGNRMAERKRKLGGQVHRPESLAMKARRTLSRVKRTLAETVGAKRSRRTGERGRRR